MQPGPGALSSIAPLWLPRLAVGREGEPGDWQRAGSRQAEQAGGRWVKNGAGKGVGPRNRTARTRQEVGGLQREVQKKRGRIKDQAQGDRPQPHWCPAPISSPSLTTPHAPLFPPHPRPPPLAVSPGLA